MSLKERTRIDWCDYTWNPVWGCLHGCPYCYARVTAKKYGKEICGRDDFYPTWVEKNFRKAFPKKPSRIFVNSMSDPFFYDPAWMDRIIEKIKTAPQHTFLWLTKNPCSYVMYGSKMPSNCLLGLSWDGSRHGEIFSSVPYEQKHFLSIEPLLERPHTEYINWKNVCWVIIGPESDSGGRENKVVPEREWYEMLVKVCRENSIPIFMKSKSSFIWGKDLIQEYPA